MKYSIDAHVNNNKVKHSIKNHIDSLVTYANLLNFVVNFSHNNFKDNLRIVCIHMLIIHLTP